MPRNGEVKLTGAEPVSMEYCDTTVLCEAFDPTIFGRATPCTSIVPPYVLYVKGKQMEGESCSPSETSNSKVKYWLAVDVVCSRVSGVTVHSEE